MTAITQITNNALQAAKNLSAKNAASIITHIPSQAIEQTLHTTTPAVTAATLDMAPQLLTNADQTARQASRITPGIGKSLLAIAAAALAFLFVGPIALKFAARSAGFLFKAGFAGAKALLSPKGITMAVERGLLFFATLETALPFIKPLLSGTSISQHLAKLGGNVAKFGENIAQTAPRIIQMAGNVAGPEAGQAVQYITGPQVTSLIQRVSQVLKKLAQNAPEVV